MNECRLRRSVLRTQHGVSFKSKPALGEFRWPAPVASVVTLDKAITMYGAHYFRLDDMCVAHIIMADVEKTRDKI